MQLSYFEQVHLLELRFVCFAESKSGWEGTGGHYTAVISANTVT